MSRVPKPSDLLRFGLPIVALLYLSLDVPRGTMRYLLIIMGLAAGALLMVLAVVALYKPRK